MSSVPWYISALPAIAGLAVLTLGWFGVWATHRATTKAATERQGAKAEVAGASAEDFGAPAYGAYTSDFAAGSISPKFDFGLGKSTIVPFTDPDGITGLRLSTPLERYGIKPPQITPIKGFGGPITSFPEMQVGVKALEAQIRYLQATLARVADEDKELR